MDCNKQLHIKVNGPPVELCTVNLFIVVQTGFKQEQKQHLFFSSGRISSLLSIRDTVPTTNETSCANPASQVMTIIHSLLHNTERFVNYDWAINTLSYHIHVFHTYSTLTNSAMRYCYFFILFFTLEKYRTLMIGPLWLCFLERHFSSV